MMTVSSPAETWARYPSSCTWLTTFSTCWWLALRCITMIMSRYSTAAIMVSLESCSGLKSRGKQKTRGLRASGLWARRRGASPQPGLVTSCPSFASTRCHAKRSWMISESAEIRQYSGSCPSASHDRLRRARSNHGEPMPSTLRDICFDCADQTALAGFWAEVLGYELRPSHPGPEDPVVIIPPDASGLRIWFNKVPEPKISKNRVHIDVNMTDGDEMTRERSIGRSWLIPRATSSAPFLPGTERTLVPISARRLGALTGRFDWRVPATRCQDAPWGELAGRPSRRLDGIAPTCHHGGDRARRGASGALYPQSAIAGRNSALEAWLSQHCSVCSTLKTGFCAAEPREPRQVRKEAAVSGQLRVTQRSLV